MKRRLLVLLLTAALLTVAPVCALADYNYEGVTTPNIIVIDANDLTAASPIYERAADARLFPASTTKILTCIVALENGNLDAQVTVGEEIKGLYELKNGYTENSSLMGLVLGETVTLRDLLYGLMLPSGNEAADAIAVAVGGTIDNFMALMNQKAAELGMTGSHFKYPCGVHSDDHYTTARDMAKLTAYALNNKQFCAIVSTPVYTVPANDVRQTELKLVNSNLLITAEDAPQYSSYPYPYCIGVKTGLTTKAGSCLIAAAEQDGARVIVCLFGDSIETKGDQLQRFTTARGIFEDLFANTYTTINGGELNLQSTFACPVEKGRPEDLNADGQLEVSIDPSTLTVRSLPTELEKFKNDSASITADVAWTDSLAAPIRQGQYLGTVTYKYGERVIFSTDLTAPHDVLEVAVLSSSDDPGAAAGQPTAGLLTEPTTPAAEKKGLSPLLIALIALVVLLGVIVAVSAIVVAQKRKRRRLRKQQRRREQQQRSGQSMQRSGQPAQRSGQSAQRSGQPTQRSGQPAQRSGQPAQRSGRTPSDAPRRRP